MQHLPAEQMLVRYKELREVLKSKSELSIAERMQALADDELFQYAAGRCLWFGHDYHKSISIATEQLKNRTDAIDTAIL